MEELFLSFRVLGVAQPAGSKRAFVPRTLNGKPIYKNGRIVVNVVDDCKGSKAWKRTVKDAAKMAMIAAGHRSPCDGPVRFVCRVYKQRPKTHFRTGKFADVRRDDAPEFLTTKPDVLKYGRAIEDALTGVVYVDDAQIVRESLSKDYGDVACVDVQVWRLS